VEEKNEENQTKNVREKNKELHIFSSENEPC
jgi:hypothetical protein